MNLLDASKIVQEEHVLEAVAQLEGHPDFSWLYAKTGREQPDYRYVVVRGRRYPSKAFGFFVAQIAGETNSRDNDMNVNQAVAPLRRLGYVEVNGPGHQDTVAQESAREQSYYSALARPAQRQFRQALLAAYRQTCAVSGCTVPTVLEAGHIRPFRVQGEDSLANGILLRIDLHRLFDAHELAINPDTLVPVFAAGCAAHYQTMPLKDVKVPTGGPTSEDLRERWNVFTQTADGSR